MPEPSSTTRMSFWPPCSTEISIRRALLSRLFSTSLLDHAGRSFDDLASRDFVDQQVRKNIDDRHAGPDPPKGMKYNPGLEYNARFAGRSIRPVTRTSEWRAAC